MMRSAGAQKPDMDEGAIKSWLDALASGGCDARAFLQAMQARFSSDPEGMWEVLSQLDQYYRRGRIETEAFKTVKTALAESVLGRGSVPVARDVVVPARAEHADAHARTDAHMRIDAQPRIDESQSPEAVAEPQSGSVLRRRYRIEAVVGQSSMGTLFQVLDEFRLETPGSQRLAVKVLHAAVAKRAELLAELRREFQSLQMLSHPNIVRVFEFDRDGELVFFTMELLTGAPLSRVMQVRKLIPPERAQALALIRDVGVALAYAHSRGVVHGDLNLRNIFITGAGELRVLGFGGSHKTRQISGASDHETLPFAAAAYASCQVLEGERADARDDVFALACVAYMLLSGDHPFSMKTAVEARDSRLKLQRPAGLSGRQWHALRAALRWEREQRPSDVQHWLRQMDLRGAAKRLEPLTDFLEPPAYKESRSRRPAAIAAGVALLLAGAYWIATHRATLPRIDSTAQVRVPDVPVRPPADTARPSTDAARPPADTARPSVSAKTAKTPPPTRIPVPAPQDSPAAAPAARNGTASPVGSKPAVAAQVTAPPATVTAPPAAAPPAAATPPVAAPSTTASQRVAAAQTGAAQRVAAPAAAPSTASAGPSKVEFASDTVDVDRGEPSAQVTVHRKGNLHGSTSFTWWTESGTAKPGVDFSAVVPQLAYIGDGKSTVSLSIPVSNAPHAQSKTFYVVIDHSEGGAILGARTLAIVTLAPSR
ncbi:MAG TPA: protein kinase [Steroidobacteraceae bacterium]|nr:protein kinase [Steroidobacteraceae bacterium]